MLCLKKVHKQNILIHLLECYDDANRFRANLKILICDESRRISMGKKARDIVVNSYSFDAFFQSFNSVIKDKYSIDFE